MAKNIQSDLQKDIDMYNLLLENMKIVNINLDNIVIRQKKMAKIREMLRELYNSYTCKLEREITKRRE